MQAGNLRHNLSQYLIYLGLSLLASSIGKLIYKNDGFIPTNCAISVIESEQLNNSNKPAIYLLETRGCLDE